MSKLLTNQTIRFGLFAMQKITKSSYNTSTRFPVLENSLQSWREYHGQKLNSDLPPTFEAPGTPHSFLDCCRSHSTATPSPQYIVIAANFFTHPSNKIRFKVNINTNMAVSTVYWCGLFWTAGLPPSLSTSSSFFFIVVPSMLPIGNKSALNGGQGISPETAYYGFVAA